jgi:predicted secreted protein
MFNDNRSRQLVMTSHCLLNQNSISDGTADLPSQLTEVIQLLMANKIGIIQLPCPELLCLGLDRQDKDGANRELLKENSRIRSLLQQRKYQKILKTKAEELADQIAQYQSYDFNVLGLIGINRSPSCGIETTSIDCTEQPGKGVFMEIIAAELQKRNLPIKMVGVKTSDKDAALEKVNELLKSYECL